MQSRATDLWSASRERVSREVMSVLAETALSTQLDYLLTHSAFYRAKFAGAHRVSTRAELAALPFMEKDELRASQQEFPPFGNYLTAAPQQNHSRAQNCTGPIKLDTKMGFLSSASRIPAGAARATAARIQAA